ncbi:hypothetical protein CCR75_005872 [Bremia lactucae]|uniref:Uncharacterized protein n=1 Tax=Bremia lactucae TaxID=4779 RepID=A0A976FLX0_BRELC|nr:hypothetical protein CCR75_005872 [Bremia lactucae]
MTTWSVVIEKLRLPIFHVNYYVSDFSVWNAGFGVGTCSAEMCLKFLETTNRKWNEDESS